VYDPHGVPGSLVGEPALCSFLTTFSRVRDDVLGGGYVRGRDLSTRRHDGVRMPWSRSERRVPRLLRPLQTFLQTEAAGGALLLAAAVAALVWANSPWRGSYERLWHTELTLTLGSWTLSHDLREWINEGLMTVFFFVVGLEIKREVVTGELRDPRAAALPILAAVGGMATPALLYLAFNAGTEGSRGWPIPMATDIAFALGVLTLAGRNVSPSLKLFLLALAIVDDIGAILVIAVLYSGGVAGAALGVAAVLIACMLGLHRIGVRATAMYVALGAGVWLAFLQSGVHATIAGVLVGLLTPASPFQRPRAVSEEARRVADETVDDPFPSDADAHHWLWLAGLSREAVSPLGRMEHLLHPWTSFVIVPIFALANAGVFLEAEALGDAVTSPIVLGIAFGLVVGKVLGITLVAWGATRIGLARLPDGVGWFEVLGVASVAGIGFTVSLFVAGLAFGEGERLDAAKLGVLGASLLAGVLGAALLSAGRRRKRAGTRGC
jgi:NhaA family Na+:H+ antiporter